MPGIDATGYKVKESGCWNCYMQCGSVFDVPDGEFEGKGYENPEYETMWSFGANCLNADFAGLLAANKVCDDYGVDSITAGNAVGFLMECYERGYITKDDLNGVELTWGNAAAMVEVTRQIVTRSSRAGNWIADGGVRNAARVIGRDSADFAMHIKGLEFAAYDPRGLQAYGVGQATSNMGAHHQICYPVQELFGFPEQVDRFSTEDKGRHAVWSNNYIMIFDCAVACGFPNAFTESRLDFDSFPEWLYCRHGRGVRSTRRLPSTTSTIGSGPSSAPSTCATASPRPTTRCRSGCSRRRCPTASRPATSGIVNRCSRTTTGPGVGTW